MNLIESLINKINDNNECLICERTVDKHRYICDHCHSLFEPINLRLARNFQFIDEAYSCFYYNELMRRTLYDYKFKNKRYYGRMFAEMLTDKIFTLKLHNFIDYILPVPLSEGMYKKRGFNQSELMGKYVSEKTGIPMSVGNLIKIKESMEQARLDSVDRLKNLDSAFEIRNPEEFQGKNILILDDLITTGTTVDKCAEVLKDVAAKVIALSVTSIRQ